MPRLDPRKNDSECASAIGFATTLARLLHTQLALLHVLMPLPRNYMKYNVELIVLPTRGLKGLKHYMLGSTAEKVVRHARCPVLTSIGIRLLSECDARAAPT